MGFGVWGLGIGVVGSGWGLGVPGVGLGFGVWDLSDDVFCSDKSAVLTQTAHDKHATELIKTIPKVRKKLLGQMV